MSSTYYYTMRRYLDCLGRLTHCSPPWISRHWTKSMTPCAINYWPNRWLHNSVKSNGDFSRINSVNNKSWNWNSTRNDYENLVSSFLFFLPPMYILLVGLTNLCNYLYPRSENTFFLKPFILFVVLYFLLYWLYTRDYFTLNIYLAYIMKLLIL